MIFFLYLSIAIYFLAMILIFFYSLIQADLLINFLIANKKKPVSLLNDNRIWPKVTIQLPVFNEKYVVERLIHSIALLDYPGEQLEIQILDDSTDETSLIIQETISKYPNINFVHLRRTIRTAFKAGALKEGLAVAHGDFMAIFDADFIPSPGFLKATVPQFDDEGIGMVQTRWTHINENYSMLTKLQAFALDAHFLVEQVGRNAQHAFMNFNGTAGVWRKSCILDAGNWNDDTLTEDLDLSYRAQSAGWKFIYLPYVEAPAELPPVMSALKSQQYRWTKGGAECARKHLKMILRSNLPFKTKVHAFAHLLNSTVFILVLTVSLASIPIWLGNFFAHVPKDIMQWAGIFLLSFVIISAVYITANTFKNGARLKNLALAIGRLPLFLAVSMGLSLHNSLAVWEGLTGKKTPFIRTPKFNVERHKSSLQDKLYLTSKVPPHSYLEALLALLFTAIVVISIIYGNHILLPFHVALSIGYSLVAYSSFRSHAYSH